MEADIIPSTDLCAGEIGTDLFHGLHLMAVQLPSVVKDSSGEPVVL